MNYEAGEEKKTSECVDVRFIANFKTLTNNKKNQFCLKVLKYAMELSL